MFTEASARVRTTADTLRSAARYALPVAVLLLGLYYYWFAVADRRAVFLYEHLGATPFDEVTSSRYWVAGLVAAGIALVGYNGAVWLLARIADARGRRYEPPDWWLVWLVAAPPVAAGIVLVTTSGPAGVAVDTMGAHGPALPLPNALGSAATALGGLALALRPAEMVVRRPRDLVWLVADGLALAPILLLLRAIELPGRGLSVSPTTAWGAAVGSVVVSALGLLALGALRRWRHRPSSGAWEILLAGLAVSYLGMPLLHHLLFTPPDYRYISTAANFFARSPSLQAAAVGVAGLLALGATKVRRR